ncbi:protein GVQW3-like [Oratosquilla oratoria]|uniref:protein GVQW3-like n=1 Tax=Oratosquilla oratoria TaxID=337810 RepID=UPI003F758812
MVECLASWPEMSQFPYYKPRELRSPAIFVKMEKVQYRSAIKYLFLKHMSLVEIHQDMATTLAEDAPSSATVKRWLAEFKRGRKSVADDLRSGRLRTSTTDENIDLVLDMVMDDRRISTRVVAVRAGISQERADHILRNGSLRC